MITKAPKIITEADGSPAILESDDAPPAGSYIAKRFDGTNWTYYQPGDAVPETPP